MLIKTIFMTILGSALLGTLGCISTAVYVLAKEGKRSAYRDDFSHRL